MFGTDKPYLAGVNLLGIYRKRMKLNHYSNIKYDEEIHHMKNWVYLRKLFEVEELAKWIENVNHDFQKKRDSQQRKSYYTKNIEKMQQQSRKSYKRNKKHAKHTQQKQCRESHRTNIWIGRSLALA